MASVVSRSLSQPCVHPSLVLVDPCRLNLQRSKDEARTKLKKLLQMAKQLVAGMPIEELAAGKPAQKGNVQLLKDKARTKLKKLLQMAKQLVAGLTRIIKGLYIFLLKFTLICSQRQKTSTLHIIEMYTSFRNDIIVMKRLGGIHRRCSNAACQQKTSMDQSNAMDVLFFPRKRKCASVSVQLLAKNTVVSLGHPHNKLEVLKSLQSLNYMCTVRSIFVMVTIF